MVSHLKMNIPVLVKPSQLLLSLLSLQSVAHADNDHDDQNSYDGSSDGRTDIGWLCTVVIIAIGVFIDAI